jgi:hypothetical protein
MKRDKQEGPRSGAFLLASVLHFYSGHPLQNRFGVDKARIRNIRGQGMGILKIGPTVGVGTSVVQRVVG